jgi:hypothetical protein
MSIATPAVTTISVESAAIHGVHTGLRMKVSGAIKHQGFKSNSF